jgi:vacuolar-type H+-ATPase subunit I/STV1
MPDIYISRAGMETKQLDEKFAQIELGTVKDELARLEQATKIKDDRFEQATKIKDERIHQLEESLRILHQNLDAISRVLSLNPTAAEVEMALRRVQPAEQKGGPHAGKIFHPLTRQ